MATIHVDIVSAESEIFSGTVEMVYCPAEEGEIGIAPGHAALITKLNPGEVRVQLEGGSEESFYVSGGMLEIQPKVVTVLSDVAERSDELDEAAVTKAKEEAEKAFLENDGKIDYAVVQQQLAEASARFQAVQRLKRRRN